jgi:hypothetical protein
MLNRRLTLAFRQLRRTDMSHEYESRNSDRIITRYPYDGYGGLLTLADDRETVVDYHKACKRPWREITETEWAELEWLYNCACRRMDDMADRHIESTYNTDARSVHLFWEAAP